MRRCTVPACTEPSIARGWCMGHYSRWTRTGDVRAQEPLRTTPKPASCAVDGCDRPPVTRGWCDMHYRRWRRNGDVEADRPARGVADRTCAVDGCQRPHDARGLCHGHYLRWLRSGDVQADVPLGRRRQPVVCTIPGCGRQSSARGLCITHGARLRRHGDVLAAVPIKIAEGKGWLSHAIAAYQSRRSCGISQTSRRRSPNTGCSWPSISTVPCARTRSCTT